MQAGQAAGSLEGQGGGMLWSQVGSLLGVSPHGEGDRERQWLVKCLLHHR